MILLVEGPLERHRVDDHRLGLATAAQSLGHRVHIFPREGGLDSAEPALAGGDFRSSASPSQPLGIR